MTKKITEVAFLFLLFGGSNNALAHHELANRNLSKVKKTIRVFAQVVTAPILKGNPIGETLKKMAACRHHRMMKLGTPGIMKRKCCLTIRNLGGRRL